MGKLQAAMIAYLSLILLVAILAYFEARREYGMIDARPGGPDLDHKELIWRRLRNVGALVMVAVVCDGTEGWDALWMGLCHASAAWAVFTGTHRLSLNLRRGMDWRYVSPGNWYDTEFILFSIAVGQLDIPRRDRFTLNEMRFIMAEHGLLMKASEVRWIDRRDGPDLNILPSWYAKQIHRAGTLAYCFETLVLAASVVGAVVILNH